MLYSSRQWRLFLLVLCTVLPVHGVAQPPALTTVNDTVFRADGSPASGTVLISWPAFTTSDGRAVAAGMKSVSLSAGGAFSVQLAPNAGSTPTGINYRVVYQLNDGTVKTEYWAVGTTSPQTIAQVRTVQGTATSAGQLATQQYVNAALADVVHLSDNQTITGTKQFAAGLTVLGAVQANSFVSTGSGPWSLQGSFGPLTQAAAGKSLLGFGTNGKLQVSENGAALQEVAKLDADGNVPTALTLAQTPTQCSGSFVTGIQANGDANCSTASQIQLAETSAPTGIPNYGIFWFDSTCHCPRVIANNGQPVQLGLTNIFKSGLKRNQSGEHGGASQWH